MLASGDASKRLSSVSSAGQPGGHPARSAVLVAMSSTVLTKLSVSILAGVWVLVNDVGLTPHRVGVITTAFFSGGALSGVKFGRWSERFGSWRVQAVAVMLAASILVLIGTTRVPWTIWVGYFAVAGFVNGMAETAGNLAITESVSLERRGAAFGLKQAAGPATSFIAGLSIPLVVVHFGWRWTFVSAGVAGALMALFLARRRRALSCCESRSSSGSARNRPPSYEKLRIERGLAMLALGTLLGNASVFAALTFFVDFAISHGLSLGQAGVALAMGSLIAITARVSMGWWADRATGPRSDLVMVVLIWCGACGHLSLALASSTSLVIGILLVLGAGWGWNGLINLVVTTLYPRSPASSTGFVMAAAASGAALGPFSFGLLYPRLYESAFLISGAAAALAALLMWWGGRCGSADPRHRTVNAEGGF